MNYIITKDGNLYKGEIVDWGDDQVFLVYDLEGNQLKEGMICEDKTFDNLKDAIKYQKKNYSYYAVYMHLSNKEVLVYKAPDKKEALRAKEMYQKSYKHKSTIRRIK